MRKSVSTNAENTADKMRKGRYGPREAVKGDAHPHAKLNEAAVRVIKQIAPESRAEIRQVADIMSVSYDCIRDVMRGKNWKHVAI